MTLSPAKTALLAASIGVLLLSIVLTAIARRIAIRVGFVDRPGGHKSHRAPTPYGGGWAIFAAAWIPLTAGVIALVLVSQEWVAAQFGEHFRVYVGGAQSRMREAWIILLGGVAMHALGWVDDRKPLGPYSKLGVVLAVALAVTTSGDVRLATFLGPVVSTALTVLWFAIIINSFNFLDNMDGLSAGVATICLLFLSICGLMAGQVLVPGLGLVFAGAIGGFLVWNFPPAKIFMGDAGSLLVGYMIAVVSTLTTYYDSGDSTLPPYSLLMPLVILAVPLYDFTSVVIIRLAEGRNPMKGDQRHFSHRLVDRGLSRRFAVMTIYLVTATTGLAATLLPGADLRVTLTIAGIVLMVLAVIAILEAPLRRDE